MSAFRKVCADRGWRNFEDYSLWTMRQAFVAGMRHAAKLLEPSSEGEFRRAFDEINHAADAEESELSTAGEGRAPKLALGGPKHQDCDCMECRPWTT